MAFHKFICRKVKCFGGKSLSISAAVRASKRGSDYYLQESKIPTLHFQPSLPRLPIPKLAESCERYLAAQRPILTPEEFNVTQKLTNDFSREGSEGWELNQRLVQRDKKNKNSSFISDFWYDMYLKDRRSIVLNHNPFMTLNNDPRNPSQTDRAAQIIHTAVRFRNSLRDNLLRPEVYHLNPEKTDNERFNLLRFIPSSLSWYGGLLLKAFPLDMVQYSKLFGTTRIPQMECDRLVTHSDTCHVVVLCNDQFYVVNVTEPDGSPIDINQIYAVLEAIKSDSSPRPTHPISLLPTMGRDEWAIARQDLVSDPQNARQLEKLDSALFVLSLDDSSPAEDDPKEATRVFLHNDGYNRWYDKSIQFIVSANGAASITFEHAWGDGVAVVRLVNEVYDETVHRPHPLTPPTQPPPLPEKLEFKLSDQVKGSIDKARQNLKELTSSLSVNIMMYEKFGKDYLKAKKLSPDAVIQLGFQLAYYRQYKTSPSTYESCSTAAFSHGRTETVRPASVASMNCAKGFEPDSGASVNDKIKLIREAVDWHSKLVREAATGKGFDRHLFALKCLAESESRSIPFFNDPGYQKLNTIILSTSTLATPSIAFGGFAPVNPSCYGIGYRVKEDHLGANVLTYPTRDGQQFIKNLINVLDELHTVLESSEYSNLLAK